jgi:hypothetical protein
VRVQCREQRVDFGAIEIVDDSRKLRAREPDFHDRRDPP